MWRALVRHKILLLPYFSILFTNCVVELSGHNVSESGSIVAFTQNSQSQDIIEHFDSSEEYWKKWRCTESREQFLRLFYPVLHNLTCLNNGHSSVKEKQSTSTIIVPDENKLDYANNRFLRFTSRDDQDDTVPVLVVQEDDIINLKVSPSSSTSEEIEEDDDTVTLPQQHLVSKNFSKFGLKIKRLRGCSWENHTHLCHQHIIFAIEEPSCFSRENGPAHETVDDIIDDLLELESIKPSSSKVWLYGIVCCTLTIFLARIGVVILPLLRKELYEKLIITMVGLAAGTLTGSSIFHLLPKAFSLEEKYASQAYLHRCTVIAFGLWCFFIVERSLKIFFYHKERRIYGRRKEKVSNVLAQQQRTPIAFISLTKSTSFKEKKVTSEDEDYVMNEKKNLEQPCDKCLETMEHMSGSASDKYRMQSNELHSIAFQEGHLSQVSTEAWMVIVGDSFLDFVDGLSIGTGFHESILTGLSISLGILLEEIPHELGEFAVLLNAGMAFRQALLFKFLASCTTYLGLCVGIWLGNIQDVGPYIFAMASGMFLYIALADMIPELNEAALKSTRRSVRKGLRVLLLQNIGLLMGISVIYIMAAYEDVFKKLG